MHYAVVGIGINVNQTKMPAELAGIATSLRMETGQSHSRLEVLIRLLRHLDRYYNLFLNEGAGPILRRFAEVSSYFQGKRVKITTSIETFTGTTAGLETERRAAGDARRWRRTGDDSFRRRGGGQVMLLTLDVGNTNTVLGVFRGKELVANWRLSTARDQTIDEYGILTRDLFTLAKLEPREIGGVIISSVVPQLNAILAGMADRYFGRKALFVEPGIKTGMPVHYDNPAEVGADRIVNSVAAFEKYGGPCIIVDFGTAINFDAVSERGEYLGGVLCPGDRNFGGRAFCAGSAVVPRGDQGSRENYRDEYGGVDAGGAFLRLHRYGGRDFGADEEGDGREDQSDRDGRSGGVDRRGFAIH